MRGSDVFGSFLVVEDLLGKEVNVTIASVELVEFDGKEKPAMRFKGKKKGWTFGPTAWDELKELLGSDESNDWIGKKIRLWVDPSVVYQGKKVGGIRAKSAGTDQVQAAPLSVQNPPPADSGSDIPF